MRDDEPYRVIIHDLLGLAAVPEEDLEREMRRMKTKYEKLAAEAEGDQKATFEACVRDYKGMLEKVKAAGGGNGNQG